MAKGNGERLIHTLGKLLAANPPEGAGPVEAGQVERLLRIYYRHISPDDLEEQDPQDLLGGLLAHWRLMRRRRPDEAVVRVYNPEQEEHGWRSRDTIVEVVARDMPFLVDSISAALNRRGLAIKLTIHPVFSVTRDGEGRLTALHETGVIAELTTAEAAIQLHVDRQPQESLGDLERLVSDVISDVTLATSDWLKMKRLAEKVQQDLQPVGTDGADPDRLEAHAFISWMINDHFLFIATCEFDVQDDAGRATLHFVKGSGLGLLRGGAVARERAESLISGLGVDLSAFDQQHSFFSVITGCRPHMKPVHIKLCPFRCSTDAELRPFVLLFNHSRIRVAAAL